MPRRPLANFFLVWSLKDELAGFSLALESLKHTLEGVRITTATAMFATAVQQLFWNCKIAQRSKATV
jgi:hypothetical protein